MPLAVAIVAIVGFILPAFFLFEPHESDEIVSMKMAVLISLAVFGVATASFRVFGSWWRTRRLLAEWKRNSVGIELSDLDVPVFKLDHTLPVFAVVGVVRPKLFVAGQVLSLLDENEISAVIQHELGHMRARDNLKRLIMNFAGDFLLIGLGHSMDKDWADLSEAAADEFAVHTRGRSAAIDLASALIKIARLMPDEPMPPMPAVSYAFETGESLAQRVRRLLRLADEDRSPTRPIGNFAMPAAVVAAVFAVLLATDHAFLSRVHEVSEIVMSALQ